MTYLMQLFVKLKETIMKKLVIMFTLITVAITHSAFGFVDHCGINSWNQTYPGCGIPKDYWEPIPLPDPNFPTLEFDYWKDSYRIL